MKKILLAVFIVLIGTGIFLYIRYKEFLVFFEREAPTVLVTNAPKAIGSRPYELKLEAKDIGAGLDQVVVRLDRAELLSKQYPSWGTNTDLLTLPIDGKALGLKEGGTLELIIKAFDKSFFSNGSEQTVKLTADYMRPRLEVLSIQHNGFVGGSLMVFYQLNSDDIVSSGVNVAGKLYEGSKASLLDKSFESQPNVYFSIFPIPISFSPDEAKISVEAFDQAGNEGSVTFYQKIKNRVSRGEAMAMSKDFFVDKVNLLLPKYEAESNRSLLQGDAADLSNEELAKAFKHVNHDYRNFLDQKLRDLDKLSEESRLWSQPFERPLPAKPTATFAQARTYSVEGVEAGGSMHMGVDLAQSANSEVRASNSGKVIFADDLGIYGNTVVVDHGFHLLTLYGHLSSISVNVGEEVQLGTKIGRTGATGLAGGDHLHFEFRLHGEPVTPFEWLDRGWIASHIDGQIADVKRTLLIQ